MTMKFVLSCPKGLEALAQAELKELGIENSKVGSAAVLFSADDAQAFRVLLESRLGSRLMQVLGKVRFERDKELYQELRNFPWNKWMTVDKTFRFQTSLEKTPSSPPQKDRAPRGRLGQQDRRPPARKTNTLFLSQVAKDSVVDVIQEQQDARPNVDLKTPDLSFHLHLRPQRRGYEGELLIDWSGKSLSHRGYRVRGFEAPLRENLAAGIDRVMAVGSNEPLWDQMCGSGTLVIEHAFRRLGIAPSYLRLKRRTPYAIENFRAFKMKAKLQEAKRKTIEAGDAAMERQYELEGKVFASDISPESLNAIRKNLADAGLKEELFGLQERDALTPEAGTFPGGVLFANPPYGERMDPVDEDLEALYTDLGEAWKNGFKDSRAYLFTGRPELRKVIRLRTSERHILFNGAIECRLFRYDLS
jgi:putative N6-adenine-specific DNA methylase